jgi:hypothetical protein
MMKGLGAVVVGFVGFFSLLRFQLQNSHALTRSSQLQATSKHAGGLAMMKRRILMINSYSVNNMYCTDFTI